MFIYGGLLKLLGDLTALIGPISITLIVEYIELNLNATQAMAQTPEYLRETIKNINIHSSTIEMNVKIRKPLINSTGFMIHENEQIYYPNWNEFISNGWIIGLLVLFATIAQGSFSQASTHIVNMIGIRLRTSLQGLVYRKTLLISSSCIFISNSHAPYSNHLNNVNGDKVESQKGITNESEKDQQRYDMGTITNLMSEDALNVMSFFWIAHYVWAIPLKVCI